MDATGHGTYPRIPWGMAPPPAARTWSAATRCQPQMLWDIRCRSLGSRGGRKAAQPGTAMPTKVQGSPRPPPPPGTRPLHPPLISVRTGEGVTQALTRALQEGHANRRPSAHCQTTRLPNAPQPQECVVHTQTRARMQEPGSVSLQHGPRDRGAAQTFTAERGDLSERVVTAVALTTDDAGLADTLPSVHVTGPAVGAVREAVTRQARVLIRGPVVILLQKPEAARGTPGAGRGSPPAGCLPAASRLRSWASPRRPPPTFPHGRLPGRPPCRTGQVHSLGKHPSDFLANTCRGPPANLSSKVLDSNGDLYTRMALAVFFHCQKLEGA